ncbi:MAG: DUF3592 domain-containing protein [Patescibacteria group bacterium]|jgi:hypothetical protein
MKTLDDTIGRNPLMIGVIVGFGGAALCLVIFLIFTGRSLYMISGEKASGQITGIAERGSRKSSETFAPVVTFTTPDGRTHKFTSALSTGAIPKIGQRVEVLYNPKSPGSAEINSFSALWLGSIACFIGLLVFLMIGFAGRHAVRKRERFLRNGARVDATIVEASAVKNAWQPTLTPQTIQSKFGWNISATAIDPISGAARTYTGKLAGSKPSAINPLRLGAKTVPVYVDRTDPAQYYMDVNQLTPLNLFPEKFAGKTMFQQIGVMNELRKEAERGSESFVNPSPNAFMPDADKLFKKVSPDLAKFVAEAKAAGQDTETIRKALLTAGWGSADIDKAL